MAMDTTELNSALVDTSLVKIKTNARNVANSSNPLQVSHNVKKMNTSLQEEHLLHANP